MPAAKRRRSEWLHDSDSEWFPDQSDDQSHIKDSSKPSKKEKKTSKRGKRRKKKKKWRGLAGEVKDPGWKDLKCDDAGVPFKYRCPVSLQMMWEPVRLLHTEERCDESGHSVKHGKHYELPVIQEWWKHKPGIDPLSNVYVNPLIDWQPHLFKAEDNYEHDLTLKIEIDQYRRSLTYDERKAICDFKPFKSNKKLRLAILIMKGNNEKEKNCITFLYGKMGDWDVSAVTDFYKLFMGVKGIKREDIEKWSTGQVVNMHSTFSYCLDFSGEGLEHWDVSNVETLTDCFSGCHHFNPDLQSWKLINCQYMAGTFRNCKSFFGMGLNKWELKRVCSFSEAFYGCTNFDVDVGNWKIWACNPNGMYKYMFAGCTSFRGVGMRKFKIKSFDKEDHAVSGMFHNCTSLEHLPKISVLNGNPQLSFFQDPHRL